MFFLMFFNVFKCFNVARGQDPNAIWSFFSKRIKHVYVYMFGYPFRMIPLQIKQKWNIQMQQSAHFILSLKNLHGGLPAPRPYWLWTEGKAVALLALKHGARGAPAKRGARGGVDAAVINPAGNFIHAQHFSGRMRAQCSERSACKASLFLKA